MGLGLNSSIKFSDTNGTGLVMHPPILMQGLTVNSSLIGLDSDPTHDHPSKEKIQKLNYLISP